MVNKYYRKYICSNKQNVNRSFTIFIVTNGQININQVKRKFIIMCVVFFTLIYYYKNIQNIIDSSQKIRVTAQT